MKQKLHLTDFLKLIRWKNILIYWFTTGLLFVSSYILLPKLLHYSTLQFSLKYLTVIIFFTFLGIAGNLQNNYYDYDLDKLKPDFTDFNKKLIFYIYNIIYLISLFIGIMIPFRFSIITPSKEVFISIVITVIILMFLYNIFLKKTVILGNIVIAILTTTSVSLPLVICNIPIEENLMIFIFSMIFILTLIRELLKDMEDQSIDNQFNYKTLPIVSKKLSYALLTIYFIVFYIVLYIYRLYFNNTYLVIFLFFSLLIFSFTIKKLNNKKYETTTRYIKLLMLAGIIFFIFSIIN